MVKRRGFLIACGLLALGVSACSKSNAKKTYPVAGTVVNGTQPVGGALVVFHPVGDASPEAVKSRATTKPDGTFTLSTYGTDDGAPAGEYAVTIEQWLAGARPDDPPSNRLNAKFAKPETSGLKATVAATGGNEPQTFKVTR
jgi:hypothetical protein